MYTELDLTLTKFDKLAKRLTWLSKLCRQKLSISYRSLQKKKPLILPDKNKDFEYHHAGGIKLKFQEFFQQILT